MSPEDLKKKLEEAGIHSMDGWGKTSKKTVKSPLVERQKEHLKTLEVLLQRQLESDQKQVADLGAALVRLKHGGGS